MNFAFNSGPPLAPFLFSAPLWVAAVWVITAIIHISFAAAVLQDSQRMAHTQNRSTFLVGGNIWALAVLMGGVVAAGIYWVIHHSALQPAPSAHKP